jgi:hypothetical protein
MSRPEDEGRKPEEGRLDLAIDRAVREMLDVEPPAAMRQRVIARIARGGSGDSASAFRRKAAWILAPVAAAALVVLAVLLPWRTRQPGPPPFKGSGDIQLTAETAPRPVAPRLVTAAGAPRGSHAGSPGVTSPARRETVAAATELVAADDTTGIEPLAAIEPITVATVRPASIAQAEIAISPLAPIAELQVAPLFPPDRRN